MTIDIDVQDLHYAYPSPTGKGSPTQVLKGVSFQVRRGEFVALLGRVGAGKTTLCMALNGLVPHATGGVFRGDVTVVGLQTKQHPVAKLAQAVGLVFQDPENQLVQMRVEDEVAFGPENLGTPPAEIETRVTWALQATGLAGYRDRSPLLLSGGEKQRVAIASMLAMRPQVLVLDEPTASLDPAGKSAVLKALLELRQSYQLTMFMATQELEQVAHYADRVLVLHEGRIALDDTPGEVFRSAARLQEWGIGLPQMVELGYLLARRTGEVRCFTSVGDAYRQLRRQPKTPHKPAVQRQKPAPVPAPPVAGGEALDRREGEPGAIVLDDVSFRYEEDVHALSEVNLSFAAGEFVALLGPNGSGKTTLARHLNGLLKPTRGRVLVEGHDTRTTRIGALARCVGYVFQNPDHQIFAPTVNEEVAFGPRIQGCPPALVAQRVADALGRFHLTTASDLPPASLGFAERRQVALAAVWATQPHALVVDEPTGGLDAQSQRELMRVLVEFNAQGCTVLLITHDMTLVAEYARRTVVLKEGRIVFDGTPLALFSQPELLAQVGLKQPPVKRLAERLGPGRIPQNVLTPAEFVATWRNHAR